MVRCTRTPDRRTYCAVAVRRRAILRGNPGCDRSESVLRIDIRELCVQVLLEADAGLDRVPAPEPRKVVREGGYLLLELVSRRVAAAEVCCIGAGDRDHGAGAGHTARKVLLIAIRPRSAKLVQQRRREGRNQLRSDNMCAIAEIRRRRLGEVAADVGVERVVIAKVVVSHKRLVAAVDGPVTAHIHPLRTLHLGSGVEVRGRYTVRCKQRLRG